MFDIATLSAARYGKTNVRVFRIVREGSWHHIVEYFVETLLEGEIATRYETLTPSNTQPLTFPSYTEADNSVVVATDSSKMLCSLKVDLVLTPL